MLTQERLKELFHYDKDSGVFYRKTAVSNTKVGDIAGNIQKKTGYVRISVDNVRYRAHRLVFLYMTGKLPNFEIDHINHNTSDNRWCNLREVSSKDNKKNKSKYRSNSSGVVGVNWHKQNRKWTASISVDGQSVYLGSFNSFHEAVNVRKNSEVLYGFHENHGE